MTVSPLQSLATVAAAAVEPRLTMPSTIKLGGVDPLGMRQINFDHMDQVLPGLNNVARHIRPFVVVTWAWRRARQLAEDQRLGSVSIDVLEDFVDRIEVIYAWSQFLLKDDADLPGRQVLGPLLQAQEWKFSGTLWKRRRDERQDSTAFTAAVNYGPALKTLGWVVPHRDHPSVLIPDAETSEALDAFEAGIAGRLVHPAFCEFGGVTVKQEEARAWAGGWALDSPTEPERSLMARMLFGPHAPLYRQKGGQLMLAAVEQGRTADVNEVRILMAGAPSSFWPTPDLEGALASWRLVQVRQLFRLALEATLFWITREVQDTPRSTAQLVEDFLAEAGPAEEQTATAGWLDRKHLANVGPVGLMERVEQAFGSQSSLSLASCIVDGIAFCLAEAPERGQPFERHDRLPLFRAKREADAWSKAEPAQFVRHLLETWVLAQHVYWSVGRGLADARSRGKAILRLKVVLEEDGWTLAPNVTRSLAPMRTPDRLDTAMSLARECGLLSADGEGGLSG